MFPKKEKSEKNNLGDLVREALAEQAKMTAAGRAAEQGGYQEELKEGRPKLTPEEIAAHKKMKERQEKLREAQK